MGGCSSGASARTFQLGSAELVRRRISPGIVATSSPSARGVGDARTGTPRSIRTGADGVASGTFQIVPLMETANTVSRATTALPMNPSLVFVFQAEVRSDALSAARKPSGEL